MVNSIKLLIKCPVLPKKVLRYMREKKRFGSACAFAKTNRNLCFSIENLSQNPLSSRADRKSDQTAHVQRQAILLAVIHFS